jgi:hypothetical protein
MRLARARRQRLVALLHPGHRLLLLHMCVRGIMGVQCAFALKGAREPPGGCGAARAARLRPAAVLWAPPPIAGRQRPL